MQSNYSVQIEKFAERHFIKSFEKKYKKHWDTTREAIVESLGRIDMLVTTSRAETIYTGVDFKIVKVYFRVDGTKESSKTSGNRCIVAWYPEKRLVSALLVYGKTDLSGSSETSEWQQLIRENYPQYSHLFQ